MLSWPILSVTTFLPLVGVVLALLVRGDAGRDVPLTVADGYHRICASWYRDENIPIACRIVITAGVPLGTPGATNMLRVAFVDDEH